MTNDGNDLKAQVEARKKKLQSDLADAKTAAKGKVTEQMKKLEGQLDELQSSFEDAMLTGWDKVSAGTLGKLNAWLKK
jgi:hypothetical protein